VKPVKLQTTTTKKRKEKKKMTGEPRPDDTGAFQD